MSTALSSCHLTRLSHFTFAALVAVVAGDAQAYDYAGHLLSGAYIAHETFPAAVGGSKDNDQLVFSNRAYLDVSKIGRSQYEFVTDIRDNHDFFDKVDTARLNLNGQNKFRLRLLAFKDPGITHPYFWAVGRFLPGDNGVIYNDGAEVGYKVTSSNSIGAFAGRRPQVNDERAAQAAAAALQVGIYDVYQNDSMTWNEGKYSSNMLVYAPRTFVHDEMTQSLDYIHQSFLHFGPNDRLNTYLDLATRPAVKAEDALIGYDHRFNAELSSSINYTRIDLTEYKNSRDIFETLSASSYQQLRLQSRYKLPWSMRLDGHILYGERYLDHLRRVEVAAGPRFSKLLGGHATISHALGYRRNFLSNDWFLNNNMTHYSESWEISGDLKLGLRHQDSGENLHPVTCGLRLGHVFAGSVLATLGVEYAHDERTTISSGLLTIGYRFGSREFLPIRDVAPPSERF